MDRNSVVSSNIHSIGYDQETKTLEVEFSSGGIYTYDEVSPETYDNLINAESKGKYLNAHIKPTHKTTKIS